MNKDRLVQQFADEDDAEDDDDSSGEDDTGFGNMNLMKMMQMMGGMPPQLKVIFNANLVKLQMKI